MNSSMSFYGHGFFIFFSLAAWTLLVNNILCASFLVILALLSPKHFSFFRF